MPILMGPTKSKDFAYGIGGAQTRTIRKHNLVTGEVTSVLDLDALGLPNLVEPRTYVGGIMAAG